MWVIEVNLLIKTSRAVLGSRYSEKRVKNINKVKTLFKVGMIHLEKYWKIKK